MKIDLKKLLEANQQRCDQESPEAASPEKADADKKSPPSAKKKGDAPETDKKKTKDPTSSLEADLPPVKGSKTLTGQKPNTVELEPDMYPKEIKESNGRTAVVAFGRMNPPTCGHQRLVEMVDHVAKELGGDPLVFLSRSEGSRDNPICYESKLEYARYAFGNIIKHTPQHANGIVELASELREHGYDNLVFVAGSDRIAEFTRVLNKYNGTEHYVFENIAVVSAGERDPDSPYVTDSISAKEMRAFARLGMFEEFKQGLPSSLVRVAARLYEDTRSELTELNSQQRFALANSLRRNEVRVDLARARAMRHLAGIEVLHKRARRLAIKTMRKRLLGSRQYQDLTYAQRAIVDARLKKRKRSITKIARRLLPRIARVEFARKIGGGYHSANHMPMSESLIAEMVNAIPETEYDYELTAKEVKALQEKATEYGVGVDLLETVFRRGVAMWENIETDMTFSQYGFGRVNSFLNGGKAFNADFDLVVEICDEVAAGTPETKKPAVYHRNKARPKKMTLQQVMKYIIDESKTEVPNLDDGMNKRRCDLPQLTNFDAFHKDLTDAGHSLGHDFVKPATLTPTQKHFNQEKVDKLKESGWGDKGIIISKDDHVVDGHHRWLAAHQKGEKIRARRTSLNIDDLLDFLKGKPYVEKKNLDEANNG